jgi:hypothetical protein
MWVTISTELPVAFSVTFFHTEVLFCLTWIPNLCIETSFFRQQRKFATDETATNSFSLYDISPYEQVVHDKSRT